MNYIASNGTTGICKSAKCKGKSTEHSVIPYEHRDLSGLQYTGGLKNITTESERFQSTGSYTNHPFHPTLTKHGYEHETSHEQEGGGRVHTYIHPKTQHVISVGSMRGAPAWGSNESNGNSAKTLTQHITSLKKSPTYQDLQNRLKESELDTDVGGHKAVPNIEVVEGGDDIVPEIGLDDRLFTEKELEDEEVVPSDVAVNDRFYSM